MLLCFCRELEQHYYCFPFRQRFHFHCRSWRNYCLLMVLLIENWWCPVEFLSLSKMKDFWNMRKIMLSLQHWAMITSHLNPVLPCWPNMTQNMISA